MLYKFISNSPAGAGGGGGTDLGSDATAGSATGEEHTGSTGGWEGWVNGSQGGAGSGKGGAAIGGDRTSRQGGRTGGTIPTVSETAGEEKGSDLGSKEEEVGSILTAWEDGMCSGEDEDEEAMGSITCGVKGFINEVEAMG